MSLAEILKERGYVNQHSSKTVEEITDGEKRTLYLGIDPSADSLHVGNLQAMMVLRRFLEDGHKVILLIGGGTGMIGDPSGKSEERNLLDDETIDRNASAISEQAKKLFNGMEFQMQNNADWLRGLNYIEFLRDIGKHFSVNTMLQRDSVKGRLENAEQGISYTEFSYMLLQSYDFLHLHEEFGCDLQIGGSDQWGNIASGIDLIRRKTGHGVYGFTLPLLINKSTGKKFGKSEQGAVWLDAAKTSPYAFYQFWINTEDEALEDYLLKLTTLSRVEIDAALEMHKRNKSERYAQQFLAREITTLVHGEKAASAAKAVTEVLFGDKNLSDLDTEMLEMLRTEAPSCVVHEGEGIIDVLVRSGLASSKREARQLLSDKGISLQSETVQAPERTLAPGDFQNGMTLLRRGGRKVSVLILA